MSINETVARLFTLETLNDEIARQGIKGKAKSHEVAVAALIKTRQMTNLDSWTSLYLDLCNGTANTKDLQELLTVVGAKSPNAAGNRIVMQRYPEKYGVAAKDRARSVPASTRSGRVTTQALVLEGKAAKELAELLGIK